MSQERKKKRQQEQLVESLQFENPDALTKLLQDNHEQQLRDYIISQFGIPVIEQPKEMTYSSTIASLNQFLMDRFHQQGPLVLYDPRVLIAPMELPEEKPMTEEEWLVSRDPMAMLGLVTMPLTIQGRRIKTDSGEWQRISDRKLRLFACACCRMYKPTFDEVQEVTGETYGLSDLEWAKVWIEFTGDHKPGERADLFRCIVGNPWRKPYTPLCIWLWNDGAVSKLAQGIYDDRAFDRMPILADALEEAGCTDTDILNHLRGGDMHKECPQCVDYSPCPETNAIECGRCDGTFVVPDEDTQPIHARGCWVLDLILGKE